MPSAVQAREFGGDAPRSEARLAEDKVQNALFKRDGLRVDYGSLRRSRGRKLPSSKRSDWRLQRGDARGVHARDAEGAPGVCQLLRQVAEA